jgi:hypothetical protein
MRFLWVGAAFLIACSKETPDETAPPAEVPVIMPAACGHAHNDYLHARPLLDAVERGFCSVEVDVFLVQGALLVAHEIAAVDPTRTLQSLYLDPLRSLRDAGTIGSSPFLLLIDVKSDAQQSYAAIDAVLASYSDLLTVFDGSSISAGDVTVVISGNRDRPAMEAQSVRYAAMDGRLEDLGTGAAPSLIPLISESWSYAFLWQGQGEMPADERSRLDGYVKQSHDESRRLRFYAIPDNENTWATLLSAGVDLINTDNLDGFAAFAATLP